MLWRNATVSLYTTQLPMYCCVWISTWLTAALSHGASSFSSQAVGVAWHICAVAKRAVHTHCHMHCVNLTHDLIVFLRNSPKRCASIRVQTDCYRSCASSDEHQTSLSNAVHRSLSGDRKRQTAVSSNRWGSWYLQPKIIIALWNKTNIVSYFNDFSTILFMHVQLVRQSRI